MSTPNLLPPNDVAAKKLLKKLNRHRSERTVTLSSYPGPGRFACASKFIQIVHPNGQQSFPVRPSCNKCLKVENFRPLWSRSFNVSQHLFRFDSWERSETQGRCAVETKTHEHRAHIEKRTEIPISMSEVWHMKKVEAIVCVCVCVRAASDGIPHTVDGRLLLRFKIKTFVWNALRSDSRHVPNCACAMTEMCFHVLVQKASQQRAAAHKPRGSDELWCGEGPKRMGDICHTLYLSHALVACGMRHNDLRHTKYCDYARTLGYKNDINLSAGNEPMSHLSNQSSANNNKSQEKENSTISSFPPSRNIVHSPSALPPPLSPLSLARLPLCIRVGGCGEIHLRRLQFTVSKSIYSLCAKTELKIHSIRFDMYLCVCVNLSPSQCQCQHIYTLCIKWATSNAYAFLRFQHNIFALCFQSIHKYTYTMAGGWGYTIRRSSSFAGFLFFWVSHGKHKNQINKV